MAFKPKLGNSIDAALKEVEEQRRADGTLTVIEKPKTEKQKSQERRSAKGFVEPTNYEVVKDRIKILFDDSGSMSGQKLTDAKQGCVEFMRNCQINQVAVGIYPFNQNHPIAIDTDLPDVGALVQHIRATGGTPLFTTIKKAQEDKEIIATRYIIFSDGSPTDDDYESKNKNNCINVAIESKTPIDTVWICEFHPSITEEDKLQMPEAKLLKEIADKTGGFFLIFDRNKVNFAKAFKFLAPGNRLMLASESFRKDVEAGRVK